MPEWLKKKMLLVPSECVFCNSVEIERLKILCAICALDIDALLPSGGIINNLEKNDEPIL